MKIVIAVDSFKGSLSARQVADSVERGINTGISDCKIVKIPLADGGEGTVDALVAASNGKIYSAKVHNPLMRIIEARYGIIDNHTAVIEMSAASGLPLIAEHERNPLFTTTFGTGELIRDAINRGCRNFVVGIGGSATNDAGLGMLQALGFRFFDINNNELGCGGQIMQRVARIDSSEIMPELADCDFKIACDVNNPFCGKQGAAYIYASQKGATAKMIVELDDAMQHLAEIIEDEYNVDLKNLAGAGAAGGLGGAFVAFLNGKLVSGINLVLDTLSFEEKIKDADLIIFGEGKIDKQSLMGKALQGVLQRTKKYSVPVIAICGALENKNELLNAGLQNIYTINPPEMPIEKAMQANTAMKNIGKKIEEIVKEII